MKERRFALYLAILSVAAALMAGCQTSVQAEEQSRLADLRSQPAPHNLSLLAIDFDPSLDQLELLSGQGITLLAAIRNNGQETESHVPVIARLYDRATASARPTFLLEATAYLDQVAPGQIAIVRFDRLTALPVRSHYYLTVEVPGSRGEAQLVDNVQKFDIEVKPAPATASMLAQ